MSAPKNDLASWIDKASERVERAALEPEVNERGLVSRTGDGIAWVTGLPSLRVDEIVVLGEGTRALALDLEEGEAGCVLLDPGYELAAGAVARGTGTVVRVPVGDALLGRVVDPLGRPLDRLGEVKAADQSPIDKPAPGILERELVKETLHTGTTVIDAMLPLGRGQRELILGDRATGKTTIAADAMIAQRDTDVVCVYAAIGQKSSAFASVLEAVRRSGRLERCIFVYAPPDAPPGIQWLAPYAACSMAELFSERGGHALLILDDLSKHALVHRQISLLLRRPPGREAYPGDIFYTHSRLLERAARLSKARGGGSLTALPIAETQAGDLSAYIPTNLISITDGQIYLEPRLFNEGIRPSVDVGRSVSRVGAKSQPASLKAVSQKLRLEYAQFLELETFARFGGELDERAKKALDRGYRLREVLVQRPQRPLSIAHEVLVLVALDEGILDEIPRERVADFRDAIPETFAERAPAELTALDRGVAPSAEARALLARFLRELAGRFRSAP